MRGGHFSCGIVVCVGLGSAAAGAPPTITSVGTLPGGSFSYANAVSRDGTTVVGTAGTGGGSAGFRWTQATGMQNIFPTNNFGPAALSSDGAVVLGGSTSGAARWTQATGAIAIAPPAPPDESSSGMALSGDGLKASGFFNSETSGPAWRWISPGPAVRFSQLAQNGFGLRSEAIADDGSVFLFGSDGSNSLSLRRTPAGSDTYIPYPTGRAWLRPRACTPNGQTVVGDSYSSLDGSIMAVRYTFGVGHTFIGALPGQAYCVPFGISSDGNTVVGFSQVNPGTAGRRAVMWTPALGVRDLAVYVQSLGGVTTGWILDEAHGVSGDGRTIVGWGRLNGSYRGFVVQFPAPCAADVGSQGGLVGNDGHMDNNDFVVFINLYFAGDMRADLGVQGGTAGHDGLLNNNDFVAFVDAFFGGCA